jgi:hypothetical protein
MKLKMPKWALLALGLLVVGIVVSMHVGGGVNGSCPSSQIYCPGVGCLSGVDKCVPGAKGGPSAVFSKEGFEAGSFPQWSTAKPAPVELKRCPGNYRSDGPCLMQFPGL